MDNYSSYLCFISIAQVKKGDSITHPIKKQNLFGDPEQLHTFPDEFEAMVTRG